MQDAMETMDINDSELARLSGISRPTITRSKLGMTRPRVDIAIRIAFVLDSTVECLFGDAL